MIVRIPMSLVGLKMKLLSGSMLADTPITEYVKFVLGFMIFWASKSYNFMVHISFWLIQNELLYWLPVVYEVKNLK